MALATSLELKGFDLSKYNLGPGTVNGKSLEDIFLSLIGHTLRAIDPRLSDGKTWVDFVAVGVLGKASVGEQASVAVIFSLLRAHLSPQSAEEQTNYALLTQQFESDLMWAAMLRQAIATIFWAHVAQRGDAYVLAEIDESVKAAISNMKPPYSWREKELIEIGKDVTGYLSAQYRRDRNISPDEIFHVPLKKQ